MAYNRKSLKNLRPKWRIGQSGNPAGRPPGTGFYDRLVRDLKRDDDQHSWQELMRKNAERREALKRPALPLVRCKACLHPDRALIDGLLIMDVPMRNIQKGYGVTRSVLSRHWRFHIPEMLDGDASIARDVKATETGILEAAEQIRALNGMRAGQDDKTATRVWRILETLWQVFPFDDGPRGDLQLSILSAMRMLERVQGREFTFDEGTSGDLQTAQRALEEWGRDEGQD